MFLSSSYFPAVTPTLKPVAPRDTTTVADTSSSQQANNSSNNRNNNTNTHRRRAEGLAQRTAQVRRHFRANPAGGIFRLPISLSRSGEITTVYAENCGRDFRANSTGGFFRMRPFQLGFLTICDDGLKFVPKSHLGWNSMHSAVHKRTVLNV